MKISKKNFKRPIVSNLEKLDKFKGKRKNAVTRKIKIQPQRGGLFGFKDACQTFECVKTKITEKLNRKYKKIYEYIDRMQASLDVDIKEKLRKQIEDVIRKIESRDEIGSTSDTFKRVQDSLKLLKVMLDKLSKEVEFLDGLKKGLSPYIENYDNNLNQKLTSFISLINPNLSEAIPSFTFDKSGRNRDLFNPITLRELYNSILDFFNSKIALAKIFLLPIELSLYDKCDDSEKDFIRSACFEKVKAIKMELDNLRGFLRQSSERTTQISEESKSEIEALKAQRSQLYKEYSDFFKFYKDLSALVKELNDLILALKSSTNNLENKNAFRRKQEELIGLLQKNNNGNISILRQLNPDNGASLKTIDINNIIDHSKKFNLKTQIRKIDDEIDTLQLGTTNKVAAETWFIFNNRIEDMFKNAIALTELEGEKSLGAFSDNLSFLFSASVFNGSYGTTIVDYSRSVSRLFYDSKAEYAPFNNEHYLSKSLFQNFRKKSQVPESPYFNTRSQPYTERSGVIHEFGFTNFKTSNELNDIPSLIKALESHLPMLIEMLCYRQLLLKLIVEIGNSEEKKKRVLIPIYETLYDTPPSTKELTPAQKDEYKYGGDFIRKTNNEGHLRKFSVAYKVNRDLRIIKDMLQKIAFNYQRLTEVVLTTCKEHLKSSTSLYKDVKPPEEIEQIDEYIKEFYKYSNASLRNEEDKQFEQKLIPEEIGKNSLGVLQTNKTLRYRQELSSLKSEEDWNIFIKIAVCLTVIGIPYILWRERKRRKAPFKNDSKGLLDVKVITQNPLYRGRNNRKGSYQLPSQNRLPPISNPSIQENLINKMYNSEEVPLPGAPEYYSVIPNQPQPVEKTYYPQLTTTDPNYASTNRWIINSGSSYSGYVPMGPANS
jgi:hypothetical protein